MKNRFENFAAKRSVLFKELLKKGWQGPLSGSDIREVVNKFIERYHFAEGDKPFIINHVRVALGLDPIEEVDENDYDNIVNQVEKLSSIESPILTKIDDACQHCNTEDPLDLSCYESCKYEAVIYHKEQGPQIDREKCLDCGRCVTECTCGGLVNKIEVMPFLEDLKNDNKRIYAAVAPSIAGQFGEDVSMAQLRTAFKRLGFTDMVEVALFADILTIREAYEFDELVTTEEDFFLTSCCCPVWIRLVENKYSEIFDKMSLSVSPMIASGRFLKELYSDAKVVFISPCTAKKAEAKEPNLEDAIDFVVTYQELKDVFDVADIKLDQLREDDKDQASYAGRVYARAGGVSLSVKTVVNRIAPDRLINLKAKQVNGTKECMDLLDKLSKGEDIEANFIEGMGCDGGCVGGPKTNIDKDKATRIVNEFGEDSMIMTPMDNMNIIKILHNFRLNDFAGISTNEKMEELLKR